MIILPPSAIGRGYRQLQLEELIRSTDEWFSIIHEGQNLNPWRASSYWTSEGKTHTGRVPYRRAVSWQAKVAVRWRLIGKVWRWVGEPVTRPTYDTESGLHGPTKTKPRWRWWLSKD